MTKFKLPVLLSLLFILVACNGTSVKRRTSSLEDSITDYNVSLRWSMFARIESHHMMRNGDLIPLDRKKLENVRVTGYEILQIIFNEDHSEAVVQGEINYYTTSSGMLKTLEFNHVWWYNEDLKRWFNTSDYLDLK